MLGDGGAGDDSGSGAAFSLLCNSSVHIMLPNI